MQTQIRLLPMEESDLGLHYLQFHLHLDILLQCNIKMFNFQGSYGIILSVPIFLCYILHNFKYTIVFNIPFSYSLFEKGKCNIF